jgi:hypothetical protein
LKKWKVIKSRTANLVEAGKKPRLLARKYDI